MIKKQSLYLFLKNNTSGTIPVTLLNPSLPNNNIANQFTEYVWDVSAVVYSPLNFSLQAKFNNADPFENFTGNLAAGNVNALLAALNNLNIGSFWIETGVGTTSIVTWNDNAIYGQLTVGAASVPPINVGWFNSTTIAGGFLSIDVNTINVLNSANVGSSVNEGNIQVANGDLIDVNVTASPGENTPFLVKQMLIAAPYTVTNLYSSTVPGSGSDFYSFNANNLYNYQVIWGVAP